MTALCHRGVGADMLCMPLANVQPKFVQFTAIPLLIRVDGAVIEYENLW